MYMQVIQKGSLFLALRLAQKEEGHYILLYRRNPLSVTYNIVQ